MRICWFNDNRLGLVEGDRVILSDMTQWDAAERVRLR